MQTSTDPMVPGGIVPSSNPRSLQLAEIDAESQGHLAQEFIDRVDMVCRSAITFPPRAKSFLRRWTARHVIKKDTSCLTSCVRFVAVSGCYPSPCM